MIRIDANVANINVGETEATLSAGYCLLCVGELNGAPRLCNQLRSS
jgi:hypothetical protein